MTFFYRVWNKKFRLLVDIFWCLTQQKRVFRSLPFPTWTTFGEQIAIFKPDSYLIHKIEIFSKHSFSFVFFRTVCVIRGKVVTSKMDPLIGVRVSHENHLEEGFTLTRPNGLFDFVCNCNSSISVKLKFGRSPFPFVEKSFYAFSNMVSEKISTFCPQSFNSLMV